MSTNVTEAWIEYGTLLLAPESLLKCGAGAAVVCTLLLASRLPLGFTKAVRVSVLIAAFAIGMSLVVSRVSLFDDAYISFRYARNLADGHGLVWNLSERVEGYTNFLWTVLVALGTSLTGITPAAIGLALSLAVFPANLWVTYRIERTLAAPKDPAYFIPIATLLLALQDSFATAGSTGLETGFATLLVSAGLCVLMQACTSMAWGAGGLLLVLATLARPDHAIFYAAGGAVLVLDQSLLVHTLGRAALAGSARRVLAFAAPLLLVAVHLAWRRSFYGAWVPNTFFAKSADQTYFEQGALYATTFYLSSHFWLLLPAFIAFVCWPARDAVARRFKMFVGLSFVIYNLYVAKVGGDFMFGRFYVALIPTLLIAVTQAARELVNTDAWPRRLGYALAILLGMTPGAVHLIGPRQVKWGIAEERTYYPVTQWNPLVIDHTNYRVAKVIERWHEAGLEIRLATSAIGMIGYYSQQELIDLTGLTDARVAHQELKKRGRPGHERRAEASYIAERNPHLVRRNYRGRSWEKLTRVDFDDPRNRPWYIYHYDRHLMQRIAKLTPGVRFTRFPKYLRRFIARDLSKLSVEQRAKADAFFKDYYFEHNDDPRLRSQWDQALAKSRRDTDPVREE